VLFLRRQLRGKEPHRRNKKRSSGPDRRLTFRSREKRGNHLSTITPPVIPHATDIPPVARLVAEAAAKIQSASELLFLSAGEVSNPDRSKILQKHGQFTETLFRSLRRIVHASEGGHRE
jgi:hypothetical protein